jgi:hypothetical protein
MSSSAPDLRPPVAIGATVTDEALTVRLDDGRTISVPLDWYPRLKHGNPRERSHWQLTAGGHGLHWPDLDEDVSVEALLAGQRSGESGPSLARWLASRGTES